MTDKYKIPRSLATDTGNLYKYCKNNIFQKCNICQLKKSGGIYE